MQDEILHRAFPAGLWDDPRLGRLPGIQPVAAGDWLRVDEAFAAQMRLRDQLIATRPREVIAELPGATPAVRETLERVLEALSALAGYRIGSGEVRRPDGRRVVLESARPLATLGRLCQEDFCILEKRGREHVLVAAVLCFPASWRLDEKLGRPLTAIHAPVAPYTDELARRVQRLFDGLRPERPLWRANLLEYDDPALFQPRSEHAPRRQASPRPAYLRSERQCLVKLPRTGAVVFSIHTHVIRRVDATATDLDALKRLAAG
ncbi:Protein of unknown function [Meinhardsimonia xiamenensis]|jgi:hypothetical protein|uniref:DUF3445 domain-containing protein n=1 Tax=Meinhardsimonia xiamenensis TaxID=990712 RepID=A0A1G9BAS9_9RHOB|nr:DUF3445 domain-containing protein [Meinhardsimonia xiamenensis]PRX35050.1 uncharacterized protein DUF3445 [Meinhardsimonia xiamenensis]SDK36617.1 Protein of unknown function [Meinhardsimonia xiamenensis]